ncbi:MAG: DUF898 family protein [Pseudomonadota bacterium]
MMPKGNCEFSGVGGQYFSTVFIHLLLLGAFTLGVYAPWACVRLFRLKASHTTINGKPVTFSGTGGQLLVLLLINGFLTVITLGFYGPWAICRLLGWKAENTIVASSPSRFTGRGGSFFLFYLIHLIILPLLTLGIYYLFGLYRFYAWKEEHTMYGGEKTSFGASFGGFVKVSLICCVLNAVTFGLFLPWAMCMLYRWQANGLAVGDEEGIAHFPPVKTNPVVVAILMLIGLSPLIFLGLYAWHQYEIYIKGAGQIARMPVIGKEGPKDKPGAPVKEMVRQKRAITQPGSEKKRPDQEAVNYEEEIKAIDKVIMEDDKNSDAFYNRAWLYAAKGDLEQAVDDYSKAIRINPMNRDAYYNRGLLFVKMGRFLKALRDFDKAIELGPNSEDAYCNRGNVYYQLGSNAFALEDYTKALEISPNDPDLYYNRALVHMANGEKPEATADFEMAARLGNQEAKRHLK